MVVISQNGIFHMNLMAWIDHLLPGDAALDVPCFSSAVGEMLVSEYPELSQRLELFISKQEVSFHENPFLMTEKLNEKDPVTFGQFRDVILGLYFSSKKVLHALNEIEEPLFPRGQSLPANDYDLLMPVYERGRIWRNPVDSVP